MFNALGWVKRKLSVGGRYINVLCLCDSVWHCFSPRWTLWYQCSCRQCLLHAPGEVCYHCSLGSLSEIWCPGEKHKPVSTLESHFFTWCHHDSTDNNITGASCSWAHFLLSLHHSVIGIDAIKSVAKFRNEKKKYMCSLYKWVDLVNLRACSQSTSIFLEMSQSFPFCCWTVFHCIK